MFLELLICLLVKKKKVQKACSRHIFQQSFDHYDNLEALIRNVCI